MYAPKSAAKTFGPLAQLGERLHGMEEVESSSLLRSTKLITTEPSTNWGSLVEMRQAEACLLFYDPPISIRGNTIPCARVRMSQLWKTLRIKNH